MNTFAERSEFAPILLLLTSEIILLVTSVLADETIFAIKFALPSSLDPFWTASTTNFSICVLLFWLIDSKASGFFSERSAITFKDKVEFASVFFVVIFIITLSTVLGSDLDITLLNTSALLSEPLWTIFSNIFSLIWLVASLSDPVINLLSLSDKSETTWKIKVSLFSTILFITTPTLLSSELFKTSDKNVVLSSLLLSTIKFICSCFSSFIACLIAAISFKSILPSPSASSNFPSNNFFSNCFWISFSSILLASTKSCETVSIDCFSSSDWGLSVNPWPSLIETTWSEVYKVLIAPSAAILIVPTFPKLSFDNPTSEVPSVLFSILNLVPLTSKSILGSLICIKPLSLLAILPLSTITEPLIVSPTKISLAPEILNSVTLKEVLSFIIIVELSSNWMVASPSADIISSNKYNSS